MPHGETTWRGHKGVRLSKELIPVLVTGGLSFFILFLLGMPTFQS